MKRLLKLMLPGIMGSSVMQVNLLIGTMVATSQPAAVSYLYYADRIYQLPLAVIGSAVGVVLLPELARALRTKGEEAASAIQNRSIEYALLLTLPDPLLSTRPEYSIHLANQGTWDAATGMNSLLHTLTVS